ncbi:Sir2 family NAD+-dependent deacetylase [Motiliproteus sediminis]|uniref:Sir2 family NAD+-dependent deacetylase n=1 Tax=Motiliproteus sediminis TaxID=1468178 RepID=UPI001AF0064E|nr:Sir2 family NAD+-dependent deacetylase [Motiliproteus sediminis]
MLSLRSIVVLTGAGISAESGLKTFRASDGLWENHRVEDVATPEAFERDPELVHRFYNLRRRQLLDPATQPNAAHVALAELERRFDGRLLLVTQNIDDLHERAGSTNLLHMHGELLRARCVATGRVYPMNDDMTPATHCQCCDRPGLLRPDIVWFGELPKGMERIYDELENCDLFLSIGTSGNVYPAAGFVETASLNGAYTVELNLEPSKTRNAFEHHVYGPASEVVPQFVDAVLGGRL